MAATFEYETLEALLDKCTDPNTGKEDWRYINAFCDRVNKDYDGPLISTKLIVRKLQTFQEKVSLMALSVLEACVKNCGQKYHQEIGKFRFLNELIKLISNKYDGPRTPQTVKHKIIELFYSWSVGLPSETKIKEAYLMLKRQGVVIVDPHLPSQVEQYKPTPQPRMAVFEDEDKAKLLSRLLASKHPEDLQAANRLIKNMVHQDEVRVEKLNLRVQELEMVQNNVKLLREMLSHYSRDTPRSDLELMKELFDSCEKLRTDLFKIAGTATDEGDETLSEILRANDNVAKVIEDYRRIVGTPGDPVGISVAASLGSSTTPDLVQSNDQSSNLSSLIDLDIGANNVPQPSQNGDILSNDLQALGLGAPTPPAPQPSPSLSFPPPNQNIMTGPRHPLNPWLNSAASSGIPTASVSVNAIRGAQPFSVGLQSTPMGLPTATVPTMVPRPPGQTVVSPPSSSWSSSVVNRMKSEEQKPKQTSPLDLLGQEAMNAHKETQSKTKSEESRPPAKTDAILLDLNEPPAPQPTPIIPPPPSTPAVSSFTDQSAKETSLDQLSVPLDKIQPGNLPPMNVLEKNNIKTVMHFAKDSSGNLSSYIHVVVVSTMSTNTSPIKNFTFQCAAPKSMKLKLQPPTSNELPGYNPILPPSAITQVMLLANPVKDRIRLKYRISYDLNGTKAVETGDLDNFPIL